MRKLQRPSGVFSDTDSIFLGLGGRRPGVDVLTRDSDACQRLVELPDSRSVYAVDVHGETGRIAYGTRAGTLHVTCWPPEGQNGQPSCQWSQGAPVLTVCWVGGSQLCSADTAGRCLLWNAEDPSDPQRLETEGRIVCSLARLPNGELAGLSNEGCLLLWSVSERRLLRCIQGAVPPPKLALVHLRFWCRRGLLVYPAENGRLCMLSPEGMRVQYKDAHRGLFYVVLPVPEGLLTIGEEDRRAKLWDPLPGSPRWQAMVPWSRPIVSGWPLQFQTGSVLLIDREGTAAIFECRQGSVRFLRQLPGADYRAVAGLSWEEIERRRDAERLARAHHLQAEAKERIDRGRPESLKVLAEEMASLGFRRMALGVRAQQARLEDRPLDELRLRRELVNLLGSGHAAGDSIGRYLLLLKTLWQLAQAGSVQRASQGSDNGDAWLADAAEKAASGRSVVEPDAALPLIVGAADVLGETLSGTWVISSGEAMNLPPKCSLEVFLEKYEQARLSSVGPELVPAASCQSVWWITRNLIKEVTLVDLAMSSDEPGRRVRSALCFEQGHGLGNLKPVLLLDAGGMGGDTSPASNDRLLSIIDTARTPQGISAQQWEVQRLATLVLRRLWTGSLWRRNQGKEQDDDR